MSSRDEALKAAREAFFNKPFTEAMEDAIDAYISVSSNAPSPVASGEAEAGIRGDGTESGSSISALRQGIPESDWLYPIWDRQSAVWLMRQADEVVGEVYQSLRNDSWGDVKWHCKTSDARGLEKTHTLAEAKCEASFWKYEWMKATGRAPK